MQIETYKQFHSTMTEVLTKMDTIIQLLQVTPPATLKRWIAFPCMFQPICSFLHIVYRKNLAVKRLMITPMSPEKSKYISYTFKIGWISYLSMHIQVNGVDVNFLPAKDVYQFGLRLMDYYFTKEEMAKSLIMPSTRSTKPVLDQDKVNNILSMWKFYIHNR